MDAIYQTVCRAALILAAAGSRSKDLFEDPTGRATNPAARFPNHFAGETAAAPDIIERPRCSSHTGRQNDVRKELPGCES